MTNKVLLYLYSSFPFSSVQLNMVSMRSEKPICASPASEVSPANVALGTQQRNSHKTCRYKVHKVHERYILKRTDVEGAALVEFKYLLCTGMPRESYRRWLSSFAAVFSNVQI